MLQFIDAIANCYTMYEQQSRNIFQRSHRIYQGPVTCCCCSTNNRASTVRKYGRPFRIRSDHRGENGDVWRDMVSAWGEEAKCIIVGSLVHN